MSDALAMEEHVRGALQGLPTPKRFVRWWRVWADLAFIRWANIRNEWYFGIVAAFIPLGMLAFLRMTGAIPNPETALYMAAGNATLLLLMGPMQSLSNDLAIARQRRDLEYFATLPFSRLQLVLAYTAVSAMFTIPALVLLVALGSLWFKFQVVFHPMVVPVAIVTGLSMAGLGVFLGVTARNLHHANMMNSIITFFVMFLSPIMIPRENLPVVFQWTSRLLPSSYAADALRDVLVGTVGPAFWLNFAVLGGFTLALLYLGTGRMDWRLE